VAFYGTDFFSAHLSDVLNERYGDRLACEWHAWERPRRDDLRTALSLVPGGVSVRVGMPLNLRGPFDAAWALDAAYRPGIRGFMYWIGTDVMKQTARTAAGAVSEREQHVLGRLRHLACAPHLQRELKEIGIPSQLAIVPPRFDTADASPVPLPERFTVMAYIPDESADFYGGPSFVEAARALPDVRFMVIRGQGAWVDNAPPNVEFLGMLEGASLRRAYQDSTLVVRMTLYDGLPNTVLEALSHARYVAWTYRMNHVESLTHGDTAGLVQLIRRLENRHAAGDLPPNAEGRAWVRRAYDPVRATDQLASILLGSSSYSGS